MLVYLHFSDCTSGLFPQLIFSCPLHPLLDFNWKVVHDDLRGSGYLPTTVIFKIVQLYSNLPEDRWNLLKVGWLTFQALCTV